MSIDIYLSELLNHSVAQNHFLASLTVFFASYFEYVVALILLIFILTNLRKYVPMGIAVLAAAFLSRIVIVSIIRALFFRLRPFVVDNAIHNLILSQSPKETSMPSGHATVFFAIAMAVYFYNKKWGIFFFVSAFLISIARVFGGIHWTSDIVVGAIIGVISAWIAVKFFRNFFQKFSDCVLDKFFSFVPLKKKP